MAPRHYRPNGTTSLPKGWYIILEYQIQHGPFPTKEEAKNWAPYIYDVKWKRIAPGAYEDGRDTVIMSSEAWSRLRGLGFGVSGRWKYWYDKKGVVKGTEHLTGTEEERDAEYALMSALDEAPGTVWPER